MVLLPPWIENMPNGLAKNAAINRFYIKLAAVYASDRGTIADLASLIGINYSALKSQVQSICPASEKTREGIRMLLGDDFVPPLVVLARRVDRDSL